MKQLLDYIIPNIVNHPEDVEIQEDIQEGMVTLTIKVNPEDTGRVIGKAGKVIKSIRQIARVIAIKQGTRVNVEVLDGQGHVTPDPTPSEEVAAQPVALEESGTQPQVEETTETPSEE